MEEKASRRLREDTREKEQTCYEYVTALCKMLTQDEVVRVRVPEKEKEEDSKVSRKILLLTWSRRLIYWTAVLVLLALLAVQVSKCLRLYLDDPTYFSTKIVEQRQVPFPSVTVCPEKDGYKEDVLQVRRAGVGWSEKKKLKDVFTAAAEVYVHWSHCHIFACDAN